MPYEYGIDRYASNAAALPMPKAARAADEAMTRSSRRKEAWRLAWALHEARAKAGDHEAADLIAFVDAGGAA